MENDVSELILNGMPFKEFIVYFGFGMAGLILFFLYSLYKAITTDVTTPRTWNWRAFTKGGIRVILGIILIAISVIFWKQISMFVFAVDTPVELNGWSAFGLGILNDRIVEGVLGSGHDASKYIGKKLKNSNP